MVPPGCDRGVSIHPGAFAGLSSSCGQYHERGSPVAPRFLPGRGKSVQRQIDFRKLPAEATPGLRRAAEIHLLTYAATQAIRSRRYGEAFSYIRTVGQMSLLSMPQAMMSLGLAYVGI